jgi:hypothetical protein
MRQALGLCGFGGAAGSASACNVTWACRRCSADASWVLTHFQLSTCLGMAGCLDATCAPVCQLTWLHCGATVPGVLVPVITPGSTKATTAMWHRPVT